jgi:LytS/YehU family sensor histidine kinase
LLVENALKHNTATLQDPLHIRITVAGDVLEVSNAERPRTSVPRSTGFGLESIIKRYAAFTARPVEVVRDAGRFTVRIPLLQNDGYPDR